MPKAIIIYESKFGNTKRAGETIIEGMKEAGVVTGHPKPASCGRVKCRQW